MIHALSSEVLSAARRDPGALHTVAEGGEQLRCCLRGAVAGEVLLLFSYEPPLPDSPYREKGAVWGHAEECAGPAFDGYPPYWAGLPQVLRAYDARGWIHPATRTHDGTDPAAAIAEVLAHEDVVEVHSRNIAYGCYAFAVTRD